MAPRGPANIEIRARHLTEQMVLVWQAALLVQHAPPSTVDTDFNAIHHLHKGGVTH